MAQTTGSISAVDVRVETSPDGSAWTDHSGEIVAINPQAGGRATGSRNTFDGDFPVTTTGKREMSNLEVTFLYTEGASDLFEIVRAAFEANSNFYVRWAPRGGQSGEFRFTSAVGKIAEFNHPDMDAGSADPLEASFTLLTGTFTKAVV